MALLAVSLAVQSRGSGSVGAATASPALTVGLAGAAGVTTRVSVATGGAQADGYSHETSTSADGRFVAFRSSASNLVIGDTNGIQDVFVKDRQTGATTRVSVASDGAQANRDSWGPSISADGRFVAFASGATNLVTGETSWGNDFNDVFFHDRQSGLTTRISVAVDGALAYGPSVA